jgi:hypothetical protein
MTNTYYSGDDVWIYGDRRDTWESIRKEDELSKEEQWMGEVHQQMR